MAMICLLTATSGQTYVDGRWYNARTLKLGPGIAVASTLLAAGVFGGTATAWLQIRRLDLERDLHRQAQAVAEALAAGLEPLEPGKAPEILQSRASWAEQQGGSFKLEVLEAGTRRTEDPAWM